MSHTDTSKSEATNRTSCHVSHRFQQITGNKSYILPCLTQIPANHSQQIVLLAMSYTDTSKSQATNRTSCHVSRRYQQITGNKSYILPCLTQIPANHRQQVVYLAMPHTDTSKSQATNRTSCHVSRRYQQITGKNSYFLPCLTQIPANHRQQIACLAMSHADTNKSQATNRTSCHVSHRYQQITGNKSYILPCLTQIANHRQRIVLLAMPQTDTSKSQATNRTSCHVSGRYQQITGNKTYFLPCLTQIPANHRQIVLLAMSHADTSKSQATNRASDHASHRFQQMTGDKSYFLPCLTQIPANHRQQIVHLAMSHANTSKSQATNRASDHASHRYQQMTGDKSYFLPCLTQIPANLRQQIVHLAMSHTDSSKSQATNRTSCHVSRRYQQITVNKSYFLPCLTQIPANHRQQIVHLAMSHADTSKSQATNRTSCHVSRRYQQITGNKSYILPCLTQTPANHRQQTVLLAMSHADTSKSQARIRTSCHVSHRYQPITGDKSYFLPCLTQIPANHRQQIVHLAMSHADTSKSQATNRTSCHVSRSCQQITGNKSYFLPCLTQIPANHRQQVVYLATPHTDISKSQATNRTSCHVPRRYQQIAGNKSHLLPCLTQIPANHRQQIVLLAMSHADTSQSQATNHTSCHFSLRCQQITGNKSYFLPCLTQIPANHRQQIVLLAMFHADTSKSQATNRTSCHVSHRYQQITGNKSYILPCLTQIPANHRQQIVHLAMSHAETSKSQAANRTSCHVSRRYQQITGNKSYILPCLTQIPANHGQQIVLLAMPHTDTSKTVAKNHTSCQLTHRYQNRRQQIVHLAMPHTDTGKSQATSHTSCHVSHRCQQITGNKSYFLPCLTQIPANHRQQIVHLAMSHADTNKSQAQIVLLGMSHADTSKSQATNRTSCHASYRYQQITGNKSYFLPCLAQILANHWQQIVLLAITHTDIRKRRQQIVLVAMPHADTSKSQATSSYILPCLTQIQANHRQQIVLLAMSHTDTSKPQATNRTSCHNSRRYQQITGNKSFILPLPAQILANHRQQNRSSCHASNRYQQITGNKSYILTCLGQIPNHRQQNRISNHA